MSGGGQRARWLCGQTKPCKGKGRRTAISEVGGDATVPHWNVDEVSAIVGGMTKPATSLLPAEAHGRPAKRATTLSGDGIGAIGLAIFGTAIFIMTGASAVLQSCPLVAPILVRHQQSALLHRP